MNDNTRMQKEIDEQYRDKILEEARYIKSNFKKWGFKIDILPLNPHRGWGKMTAEEIFKPELYDLWLGDEILLIDMNIHQLRKVYRKAKKYRHDYGVKKLRENIKDILKW